MDLALSSPGDGSSSPPGDGSSPSPEPPAPSPSQTTSRSPSLKQNLEPGLPFFSKTQLLLQPYMSVFVSSTSMYDTPPTVFSLQHSGMLAALVYPIARASMQRARCPIL